MIINLTVSWQLCIIVLVIILFLIWLIYGGGDHEYVGLSPLQIGHSEKYKHSCDRENENNEYDKYEENEETKEIIDNTPNIPDLSEVVAPPRKEIKIQNHFYSCGSESFDNFNESSDFHDSSESDEFEKFEMPTPRTSALGPYKSYNNNGKKSKGELLCKQAIEEIYGKPFYCVRPNFLKNPETGRNLELDLYNDELKIGVEYNSMQHYVFPNYFHRTHEEFINQIRRDQFKVDRCDANGVYLISVPYNVPLTLEDIKKYITVYLPENIKK